MNKLSILNLERLYMMHRYIEQSQQGLRFDIMTPSNRRICIAHSKDDAENIVTALDAADRKKAVIKSGMGDYQQAIIDKQSAELEYLRGFALVMLEPYRYTPVPDKATYYAKNYGLIDENSNPTPLLMGE